MKNGMAHDPELCLCGTDGPWPSVGGPACTCECEQCTARRRRVNYLWSLDALAERLERGGVPPANLADLLWIYQRSAIESVVHEIVGAAVRQALDDSAFVTRIVPHGR